MADVLKHEVPSEGWYHMTLEAIGEHPDKDVIMSRWIIDGGKHVGKRITTPVQGVVYEVLENGRQKHGLDTLIDFNDLTPKQLAQQRIKGKLKVAHVWMDDEDEVHSVNDKEPDSTLVKEMFTYEIVGASRPEQSSAIDQRFLRNKAKFQRDKGE